MLHCEKCHTVKRRYHMCRCSYPVSTTLAFRDITSVHQCSAISFGSDCPTRRTSFPSNVFLVYIYLYVLHNVSWGLCVDEEKKLMFSYSNPVSATPAIRDVMLQVSMASGCNVSLGCSFFASYTTRQEIGLRRIDCVEKMPCGNVSSY